MVAPLSLSFLYVPKSGFYLITIFFEPWVPFLEVGGPYSSNGRGSYSCKCSMILNFFFFACYPLSPWALWVCKIFFKYIYFYGILKCITILSVQYLNVTYGSDAFFAEKKVFYVYLFRCEKYFFLFSTLWFPQKIPWIFKYISFNY